MQSITATNFTNHYQGIIMLKTENTKVNFMELFRTTLVNFDFEERMFLNTVTKERVKLAYKPAVFPSQVSLLNVACVCCDQARYLEKRSSRISRIEIISCGCGIDVQVVRIN
jgi:hypothetical protein